MFDNGGESVVVEQFINFQFTDLGKWLLVDNLFLIDND